MIAAWMFYCSLCALGLALAAVLAERVLLAGRGPVRAVWVAAIALSLVVPAIAVRAPATQAALDQTSIDPETAPITAIQSAPSAAVATAPRTNTVSVKSSTSWRDLLARTDKPLELAWLTLSSLFGLYFIAGIIALAWMRGRWERRTLFGIPVFVSQRTGPAVVGAISPAIVVPEWALAMNPEQLTLMLHHEHEHQRVRDGQLLIAAQIAAVLMPWNVALWWQLVRLRVAIELDCDARVLKNTDARSYGDLLLEVARPRQAPRLLGATAFAERATQLERRIRVLARARRGSARKARAIASTIGVGALSIAWVSPHPPTPVHTKPIVAPVLPRVDSPSKIVPTAPTPRVVPANKPKPKPSRSVPSSTDRAMHVVLQRMPGPGDSVFNILFGGITLSPEHARDAHDLLDQLAIKQSSQDQRQSALVLESASRATALQAQRDTALRALLTNDADRATLDARLAQPGGRGRSGGPGALMPGGRGGGRGPLYVIDGVVVGDTLVQRVVGGQAVARGGAPGRGAGIVGGGRGGGRVGGAPLSQATLDSMATAMNAMMSDATFRRLFDGISLTDDQQSAARALISSTQSAISAQRRRPEPVVLRVNPVTGRVAMQAESAEALIALASNDADRATIRSRLFSIQ